MKAGSKVVYINSNDERHNATVADVVGSGKSGYKVLDLTVAGVPLKAIPHANDNEGNGYWYSVGEKPEPKPEDEAPKPKAKKKK